MFREWLEICVVIIGWVLASVVAGFVVIGVPLWLWGDYAVEDIKANAAATWKQQGYDVIGYEGYQLGLISTPGGCVLRAHGEPNTRYTGCLSRWKGEYHAYSVRSLNAVSGH
jgi:hypothetical protein